jgi:hypothetical protein
MAVELLILSGARQRETLRFSKSWLIVGDDDESDVCLSSKTHPQAKGQLARLEMDENGWWIHNLGAAPWFINRRILPVEGSAMLRSGDVLRLSDAGPDVRSRKRRPRPPRISLLRGPDAIGSRSIS